jgi:hypothetical protein
LRPNLFRRNLIGVLVILAAVGVMYVTKLGPARSEYQGTTRPEYTATAGGSVDAFGFTWQVQSVRRLEPLPGSSVRPLPAGTTADVVTITRDGSGPDVACQGVATDGTRRWKAAGIGVGMPLPPPGTTSNCAAPGPVQFTFIHPVDAVLSAVDVAGFEGQIMVRLQL